MVVMRSAFAYRLVEALALFSTLRMKRFLQQRPCFRLLIRLADIEYLADVTNAMADLQLG